METETASGRPASHPETHLTYGERPFLAGETAAAAHFRRRPVGADMMEVLMKVAGFWFALALTLCGCWTAPREKGSLAWSEDNTLQLNLEAVAVPGGDLQHTVLRLSATNTGGRPLVLDKEMLAGFCLRFETDLTKSPVHSDARDVATQEIKKLDKPHPAEAEKRFVTLKPGDSISRIIDLAKPLKTVCEGHMSDQDSVHYGFYYEALTQFIVPENATRLLVDAWYERGVWMMSVLQFEEWHGRSPADIGLWKGRARSDTLAVEKTSTRNPSCGAPLRRSK